MAPALAGARLDVEAAQGARLNRAWRSCTSTPTPAVHGAADRPAGHDTKPCLAERPARGIDRRPVHRAAPRPSPTAPSGPLCRHDGARRRSWRRRHRRPRRRLPGRRLRGEGAGVGSAGVGISRIGLLILGAVVGPRRAVLGRRRRLVGDSFRGGSSSRRPPRALLEGLDRQVELSEFGVAPAPADRGAVPLGVGGAAGLQVLFGGLVGVLRGEGGEGGEDCVGQRGREVNLLLGAGCQQLAGRVGDRAPVRWRLRVCVMPATRAATARSRPAYAAGSGRCAPPFTWRGARSGLR